MTWKEVRELHPNQFVKLKILQFHMEDNKKYIEEVAVIKSFDNNKETTRELVRAKKDELVYHTANESIVLEICNIRWYECII